MATQSQSGQAQPALPGGSSTAAKLAPYSPSPMYYLQPSAGFTRPKPFWNSNKNSFDLTVPDTAGNLEIGTVGDINKSDMSSSTCQPDEPSMTMSSNSANKHGDGIGTSTSGLLCSSAASQAIVATGSDALAGVASSQPKLVVVRSPSRDPEVPSGQAKRKPENTEGTITAEKKTRIIQATGKTNTSKSVSNTANTNPAPKSVSGRKLRDYISSPNLSARSDKWKAAAQTGTPSGETLLRDTWAFPAVSSDKSTGIKASTSNTKTLVTHDPTSTLSGSHQFEGELFRVVDLSANHGIATGTNTFSSTDTTSKTSIRSALPALRSEDANPIRGAPAPRGSAGSSLPTKRRVDLSSHFPSVSSISRYLQAADAQARSTVALKDSHVSTNSAPGFNTAKSQPKSFADGGDKSTTRPSWAVNKDTAPAVPRVSSFCSPARAQNSSQSGNNVRQKELSGRSDPSYERSSHNPPHKFQCVKCHAWFNPKNNKKTSCRRHTGKFFCRLRYPIRR